MNATGVAESHVTEAGKARAGKHLIFSLAGEEYGVPVLQVREIIKMMDITVVPQVPHYVRGVINLRGKVITVIDLRRKFGFPPQEQTDETAIVVVEFRVDGGKVQTGVIVDSVLDVLNIQPDEIEDTPALGAGVCTDYLSGMANVKGRVKILLDLDNALGSGARSAQE